MNCKILKYIFALLMLLQLGGCREEDFGGDPTAQDGPCSGTIAIDLTPFAGAVRTRALDMEDGATININTLWIGVYNKETGRKIGSTVDQTRRRLTTGVIAKNQITVDFYSESANPEVCIVGVANFDGVKDAAGNPIVSLLDEADTWNALMELSVDAESAYAGDKGQAEGASAPFLMGYFLNATGLTRAPKFNQFQKSDGVAMYPATAQEAMKARLNGTLDTDRDIYVPAGALVLRRLVSNVKVNIVPGDGVTVSNISYKVFNMPSTLYLAQRRTDTESPSNHSTWQSRSPNYADRFVASDGSLLRSGAYYDSDWTSVDDPTFSFQHFENKHWGAPGVTTFSQREAKTTGGRFAALCPGDQAPYNNYGSYFKIKMTVTDASGRMGDVEYTIHEGLCNNDNGQTTDDDAERYRDFASFRNNNYTYTINVNGINKIIVNAESDEEGSDHLNGQQGSIWEVEYAGEKNRIPNTGGTYGNMRFDANANLAMRFYWNDRNGNLYDYAYINMADQTLLQRVLADSSLAKVWPVTTSTKFLTSPAQIPAAINGIFTITTSSGASYTLSQFLSLGSYSASEDYHISIGAYDTDEIEGNPRVYMRALYLMDTNKIHVDRYDGCSMAGKIYAAEQYPEANYTPFSLSDADMIWHNAFHDDAGQAGYKWCGTTYSRVYLTWIHHTEARGYVINVDGKTFRIDDASQYVEQWNGKDIVKYPLYTTDFSVGKHDVTFTPIVDENVYQPVAYTATGALDLISPEWWVKSTPGLKDINTNGKTKFDYEFYGLEYSQTNSTANASSKGSYISYGGGPNLTDRVLRIFVTKSGEMTSYVRSNLTDGVKTDSKDRFAEIMIVYEDQVGKITINDLRNGLYPDQYWKAANPLTRDGTISRYDTKHNHFTLDRPAYVYFCNNNGNALYYGFKYVPD